jgi:hypothetical protein
VVVIVALAMTVILPVTLAIAVVFLSPVAILPDGN